ncbi:MAG: uridine kinase [Verrucomicrobia bacterium]|nr:uridine kinase [Verrucomicrobiota bacterium]
MHRKSLLVAIVGGSGSGKTWLAERLQKSLGRGAGRLSQDDFYRDRSHLPFGRRSLINFDHPRAIDWKLFERVLKSCSAGRRVRLPRYDFARHERSKQCCGWQPTAFILAEGLWLLRRPSLRRLFTVSIFIDCAESLRFRRRLQRDRAQRGRTEASVRKQFFGAVAPMHRRFVQPQIRRADIVLKGTLGQRQIDGLVSRIRRLLKERSTKG